MVNQPVALVTGAGGQDGTLLLAELARRGRPTVAVFASADQVPADPAVGLTPVVCDLADLDAARGLVEKYEPAHLFHLAAISSVAASWDDPVATAHVNGMVPIALMAQCLAQTSADGGPRFINASSSEIFAESGVSPQIETTSIRPNSPYGAAKAFSHSMAISMRGKGLFASNAILYNHESPLRATKFVTRKITSTVAAIAAGKASTLTLGNLNAERDWGWAPDYVDALIRIADHDSPDDFVIATGVAHSVRDFVAAAFAAVGIDNWSDYVTTADEFVRPTDAATLVGDATHARTVLGWRPTLTFDEIVAAMVRHDMAQLEPA